METLARSLTAGQLVDIDALTHTPVRYALDPWIATVTQGSTAGIEGAGGNPCKIRHLPLDFHGNPGGHTDGIEGARAIPVERARAAGDAALGRVPAFYCPAHF